MNILLVGATGTLGKELHKLLLKTDHTIFIPSSSELDISEIDSCKKFFSRYSVELVINCAAFTDIKFIEKNIEKALKVNVNGTANLVLCCMQKNIKLIQISTDHVFDGQKGFYKTEDPINPQTKYAKSKAASELVARMYENSLVIRTSFFGHQFPYKKAFLDQWSSKDFVDIIAPKIFSLIFSNKIGIIHCGSNRRTIYDIVKERNPNIEGINREEIDFFTLKDTSFSLE